jgi:hypothetical protein
LDLPRQFHEELLQLAVHTKDKLVVGMTHSSPSWTSAAECGAHSSSSS